MKIKRFFAIDMRRAIGMVSKELGSDAVILSNQSVPGGIELVAAIDFDETLYNSEVARNENPDAPGHPDASDHPVAPDHPVVPDHPEPSNRELAGKGKTGSDIQARHDHGVGRGGEVRQANYWSQEPSLVQIHRELDELRSLLERQLSGFAWGDIARRNPRRAQLIRQLMELGLSPELCRGIADCVPDDLDTKQAWSRALAALTKELPIDGGELWDETGVIALVGPTGVGKTTTIAKLAAHFALHRGRDNVALLTTDCFRIGAHEQLRTYGRILGIPVHTVNNHKELCRAINTLCNKEIILVDTVGMSQRDVRLQEQLDLISGVGRQLKTIVVLAATTQLQGLDEIAVSFKRKRIDGCVLTKLDETSSLGAAITAVIKHHMPVICISDGQRVPEDLHKADASDLINRCLSLVQSDNQQLEDEHLERFFQGAALNANV